MYFSKDIVKCDSKRTIRRNSQVLNSMNISSHQTFFYGIHSSRKVEKYNGHL